MATKGFGAPELEIAYTRTHELCRQMGDTPQIFPVLVALSLFHFVRAEHSIAQERGELLLALAHGAQDSAQLLEAQRILAFPSLWRGDVVAAREHAEQGLALYDAHQHRAHAFLYGSDPGVVCSYYAAYALWFLGYPDQALKRSRDALTLAHDLSHPFSTASACTALALLHQLRGETQSVQESAEAAIALCTEHGIPFWLASGTIFRGWAQAEHGQVSEGLEQLQQGIAAMRSLGGEAVVPYYLAMLAEIYEACA